jgi:uncharacterized YigZ family protein
MNPGSDSYQTIEGGAEGLFRDRGSRFAAFARHVESEEEIRGHLAALRKKYYDATHHCYAWRLGPRGEASRSSDDGEPPGSAGKPILGQLLSRQLTDVLVVVVRWFGGTLLGVPGLIAAYRGATAGALDNSRIVTMTEEAFFEVLFPYPAMNEVMRVVKGDGPRVVEQAFDNLCRMVLAVPRSDADALAAKLEKVDGVQQEFLYHK